MHHLICFVSAALTAVAASAAACFVCGPERMPVRYNVKHMPTYARLVNFTERIWDYSSCVESQLKIWLARHLLAKENSGGWYLRCRRRVPVGLHPSLAGPFEGWFSVVARLRSCNLFTPEKSLGGDRFSASIWAPY